MGLHSSVFKVALASAIGLFAVIGSQEESAASDYRYLCTSMPAACEYAPTSAPSLRTDVCSNGSASYLKGTGSCPTGYWAFYVDHGEVVDAMTNEIAAYIPLDDACAMNFCTIKPPEAGPGEPGAMCCGSGGCTDLASGSTCGSNTVTVWCLDGEEAVNEGGSWVCYESE